MVHAVQWFMQFCGSVVRTVQWFSGSCSSVVHAVQWFMQFSREVGAYCSVVYMHAVVRAFIDAVQLFSAVLLHVCRTIPFYTFLCHYSYDHACYCDDDTKLAGPDVRERRAVRNL